MITIVASRYMLKSTTTSKKAASPPQSAQPKRHKVPEIPETMLAIARKYANHPNNYVIEKLGGKDGED